MGELIGGVRTCLFPSSLWPFFLPVGSPGGRLEVGFCSAFPRVDAGSCPFALPLLLASLSPLLLLVTGVELCAMNVSLR
jgi:hypothetical protein